MERLIVAAQVLFVGGGCGTIFKIKPDGTSYSKLLDFTATNGSAPLANLYSDGTFLYGMTSGGGSSTICSGGCGTIFKIKPDGTSYSKLLDFTETNGSLPTGSFISDGTFLYGMTSGGGSSTICSGGCGTIFKIKPDGTNFTNLLSFNGTNGRAPRGDLLYDGTFLYGMTYLGGIGGDISTCGASGCGTIFKIKPDGTEHLKLLDFNGPNGRHPWASLVFVGTTLYGTTAAGGANGYGIIFKINPNGAGYFPKIDFAGGTNGSYPQGSLMSDGTFLYGTTVNGGSSNKGIIFKYEYCQTLAISDNTTYNGTTWSTNNYSDITIGTIITNTITATTDQVFKFSDTATLNGPFSSGTTSKTLGIVTTPCP